MTSALERRRDGEDRGAKLMKYRAQSMLEKYKGHIGQILPAAMGQERFQAMALMLLGERPDYFDPQKTDQLSLIRSVLGAANLGLPLGGPMPRAYLVKYGRKVEMVCDYRGLIELADRAGYLIRPGVIHANDHYEECEGTELRLVHRPNRAGPRGEPILWYAVARLKETGMLADFIVLSATDQRMVKAEAMGARKDTRRKGPWFTDTSAMRRKTAIRALCNTIPATAEVMGRADAVEEGVWTSPGVVEDGDVLDTETGEVIEEATE